MRDIAPFKVNEYKRFQIREENKEIIIYDDEAEDQTILCKTTDKKEAEELVEKLNTIFAEIETDYAIKLVEKDLLIKACEKMIDYYQEVISNTLKDKLDDLDTMFAMKKMMQETMKALGGLTDKLLQLKEKQEQEQKEEGNADESE